MATYSTKLSITSEGTYSIELNRWSATINVSTTSTDFFNKTISVSRGGTSLGDIAFDGAGQASIDVHEVGTYIFSITFNGETYTQSVSVTEETTYAVTLNRWTATIRVYTAASDFYGQKLSVSKGDADLGTITIDNTGYAYYLAHEAGVYEFTLNYSERESYTVQANATAESTYDVTLTRYESSITLTTTSTEFYGHSISVTKDGTAYDTVAFDSTGNLVYDVHADGVYAFTLTYSETESYTQSATISASGQSRSLTINRWSATVTVSTSSSDFYGHAITVYRDDVEVDEINFSSTGSVVYTAHKSGTYKFVLVYSETESYPATVSVTTDGGTYTATLNRWTATINVSTSSTELVGQTLTVSKDGTAIDTVTLPSSTGATVAYTVHAAGTYKFSIIYSGDEYASEVSVVSQTTYSVNVSLAPDEVPWATGTDDEIEAMLDGHYAGVIDVSETWAVGDVRQATAASGSDREKFQIGANTTTRWYNGSGWETSHNLPAQTTVKWVIIGLKHDNLVTAQGGISKAAVTIQMVGLLNDTAAGSTNNYMSVNDSNVNNTGWNTSVIRGYLNGNFYNALKFKNMVKRVKKSTAATGNTSSPTWYLNYDYCFLVSEWEVFGSKTYSAEDGALGSHTLIDASGTEQANKGGVQYEYYKTSSNRIKKHGWEGSGNASHWWLRSPRASSATSFCRVGGNGSASYYNASNDCGVSVAACL